MFNRRINKNPVVPAKLPDLRDKGETGLSLKSNDPADVNSRTENGSTAIDALCRTQMRCRARADCIYANWLSPCGSVQTVRAHGSIITAWIRALASASRAFAGCRPYRLECVRQGDLAAFAWICFLTGLTRKRTCT